MTITSGSKQSNRLPSAQAGRRDSLSFAVREFFKKADNRVMRLLNEHGKRKPSIRRPHPPIKLTGDESFEELIMVARDYDAKEFFAYKRLIPKASLRFHYRVVAKVYRTGRDAIIGVGIKLYRVLKKVSKS